MNFQKQKNTEQFITPYLPKKAKMNLRSWEGEGKHAVQRVVPIYPLAHCRNCQDHGVVYVTYLGKGPSKAPITLKRPSTYVKSNGKIVEGWYLIDNTVGYICPNCEGSPESLPAPEINPEVQQEIRELTKEKAVNWQDW